nr:sulfotransferase domain-containing protein [Ruegeria sp. HKCCA5491]
MVSWFVQKGFRVGKVDFIGIGAQKAATTWLHHVLSEHSSVTTNDTKELNFFTANFDRGYAWYESCFADAPPGNICGECSPTYFFSSDAPRRARAYNKDLKLICILRDPIGRVFSNHLHEIRKGHIAPSTSVEAGLAQNPAYVQQSQYKTNLENWLQHFDRDALLVLFSEEVAASPDESYDQICGHLGLSAREGSEAISERFHENITYRNKTLQKSLRFGGDMMRSLGMGDGVKKLKTLPGLKQMLSMNKQHLNIMVPPPTSETRERLANQFRPDMEFVAELTGRETLPWSTWSDLRPADAEQKG